MSRQAPGSSPFLSPATYPTPQPVPTVPRTPVIAPPAGLPSYAIPLDNNYGIRWLFWSNNITTVNRSVVIMRPDGSIQTIVPGNETITANRTSQLPSTSGFPNPLTPLGVGWLLSASAAIGNVNIPRGNIYARVELRDGAGNNIQTLTADYLTGSVGQISWPNWTPRVADEGNGRRYNTAPASPAAGAEVSITVPTGAIQRLDSIHIKLVAAVAVASRTFHLIIDDGTNVMYQAQGETPAVTSGQTRDFLFEAELQEALETAFDANNFIRLPLPTPTSGRGYTLPAGYRIRTVSTALQAGDQYSIPNLEVEEWLTP